MEVIRSSTQDTGIHVSSEKSALFLAGIRCLSAWAASGATVPHLAPRASGFANSKDGLSNFLHAFFGVRRLSEVSQLLIRNVTVDLEASEVSLEVARQKNGGGGSGQLAYLVATSLWATHYPCASVLPGRCSADV